MAINGIQGGGQQIDPQKLAELLAQALQKKGGQEGGGAAEGAGASAQPSAPASGSSDQAQDGQVEEESRAKQPEDMAGGSQDIGAGLLGG